MPIPEAALEQLRYTNLGRLLEEVHGGFDQTAIAYLRDAGYPWLTAAHIHVMRTMRVEGASISGMAAQARISKQAMSKLVMVFENKGLLQLTDDPDDGRFKIAFVTDTGVTLLKTGIAALQKAEDELAGLVGRGELENLRRTLRLIRDVRVSKTLAGNAAQRRRK